MGTGNDGLENHGYQLLGVHGRAIDGIVRHAVEKDDQITLPVRLRFLNGAASAGRYQPHMLAPHDDAKRHTGDASRKCKHDVGSDA